MTNEIYLYGTVGGGFWDEDFFTSRSVQEMLEGREGPLTVRINSGGGIASDGQTIYSLLRSYPGTVEMVVDGIAASAASLIVMAGDTIVMRDGAVMMIHDPANPWVDGRGTEDDHLKAAAGLSVTSKAYAGVYARRAGMSVDDAREIMRAETYYDGPEAVAAGFADVVDEAEQSEAVAVFDYTLYGHAPAALRKAGARRLTPNTKSAILAMMSGDASSNPKGKTMPPIAQDQREEMETEEDQLEDEQEVEMEEGVSNDDEMEDETSDEDDDIEEESPPSTASSSVAVQIMDLCTASNRPHGDARDMISRGLSLQQAVAEITTKRQKENPVNGNRQRPATARSTRDDRMSRRTNMALAMAAQITRAPKVAAAAQPFMSMSLAQMAAKCIDHKGPLRTAGDRQQVFMAASHSTSDFPGIFENALNKVLLERYQVAEPTFRLISRRRDFADFRPHPQVRAGDFPRLKPIGENGEIKYGTFGESRESAVLASYGVALRISRQMMINDEMGAIDDVLADYGQMVADFEEQTFYAFALAATLSDGKAVFHADHKNLAAAGTGITVDAVAAGRAAIRKQTTIDGQKMNMTPSIILVGPDKETEAEQLVAAIQPQEAGKVNPFSGRLTPVVTAQIAGNAWHLLAGADRPGGALWTHGYLEGAAAPRIRMDEPFGQQGMGISVEHDFGLGAIDYRGGWKNPGA